MECVKEDVDSFDFNELLMVRGLAVFLKSSAATHWVGDPTNFLQIPGNPKLASSWLMLSAPTGEAVLLMSQKAIWDTTKDVTRHQSCRHLITLHPLPHTILAQRELEMQISDP